MAMKDGGVQVGGLGAQPAPTAGAQGAAQVQQPHFIRMYRDTFSAAQCEEVIRRFEADERTFKDAAVMLRHLGIARVRLLTNNPTKVDRLVEEGIAVIERVPHQIVANRHNRAYLETKARRAGHLL